MDLLEVGGVLPPSIVVMPPEEHPHLIDNDQDGRLSELDFFESERSMARREDLP